LTVDPQGESHTDTYDTYRPGATVTLTATADNFLVWEGDIGGGQSTQNQIVITMDKNRHIKAVCKSTAYKLTTNVLRGLMQVA